MMRRLEPPREILLPETVRITPSKYNPWRGRRRPDDRYTIEQLAEMHRRSIDPATVAFVTVRQASTYREWWVGEGRQQPVYVMPCPILREAGPDRVEVIAPMGSAEFVTREGKIIPRKGYR